MKKIISGFVFVFTTVVITVAFWLVLEIGVRVLLYFQYQVFQTYNRAN